MILGFGDPLFYLYLLYFFVAIFLAFFIPGSLILKKIQLSFFSRITLSPIVGMVLWMYQGVVFGYLNIRWASYIYLLITLIAWFVSNYNNIYKAKTFFKVKLIISKIDKIAFFIILFGSLIQISTVWFQGYKELSGFSFYSLFPDSFYHLALTDSLIRNFPPFEPGASNIVVHSYHYLGNLIIADLVHVFKLPLIQSSYQYLSIFFAVWMGLLSLVFAKELNLGKAFGRWMLIFLYFSGDIIFLIFLYLGRGFKFDVNLPEKATTLWVSPPRVFALIVLLAGLIMLYLWIKRRSLFLGFITALMMASLIGIKVYLGIFALSGLGFLGLFYLIKRDFKLLIPLISCVVIALSLYLPVNSNAGGLVFSGFWRIENFAVSSQLGLDKMELARSIFLQHNNYIRVIAIESFYFLLYVYSLGGMFLVGFIQSKKSLSFIPHEIHLFLLGGLIVSLFFGLFFLQTSGGANTTQFLFSLYIVGSVYAALSLSFWFKKLKNTPVRFILILVIFLLLSARVMSDEYKNIVNIAEHKVYTVSNKELEATDYLRKNTGKRAIIMVDQNLAEDNDCYDLVFLTDRPFFLCGAGILRDHGRNIKTKEIIENSIFTNRDAGLVGSELINNNISYIFLNSNSHFYDESNASFITKVFDNGDIKILKVNNNF